MTGLTLACTGACLCLSVPSYQETSLCSRTVYVTKKWFVFLCVFSCLWRVSEEEKIEEDWEKETEVESKQSGGW